MDARTTAINKAIARAMFVIATQDSRDRLAWNEHVHGDAVQESAIMVVVIVLMGSLAMTALSKHA